MGLKLSLQFAICFSDEVKAIFNVKLLDLGSSYSSDLPQSDLKVPYTLTFSGEEKDVGKVKNLLSKVPMIMMEPASEEAGNTEERQYLSSNEVWLRNDGCFMIVSDRKLLKMLNDMHITFAQRLLSTQFPCTDGLIFTVWQNKVPMKKIEHGEQIIHDRGNHWIVASTLYTSMDVML